MSWSDILQIFFYFQTLKNIYYSFLTVSVFSEYTCIHMRVMLSGNHGWKDKHRKIDRHITSIIELTIK